MGSGLWLNLSFLNLLFLLGRSRYNFDLLFFFRNLRIFLLLILRGKLHRLLYFGGGSAPDFLRFVLYSLSSTPNGFLNLCLLSRSTPRSLFLYLLLGSRTPLRFLRLFLRRSAPERLFDLWLRRSGAPRRLLYYLLFCRCSPDFILGFLLLQSPSILFRGFNLLYLLWLRLLLCWLDLRCLWLFLSVFYLCGGFLSCLLKMGDFRLLDR